MKACTRGKGPPLLLKYAEEIAANYAKQREQNPAHQFKWPHREGQSLYKITFDALRVITGGHCAYCDGHPIDALGEDQVDHFKPKTRPEFYMLVGDWGNLFLACYACNKSKLAQWEDALLRPDDPEFSFERYFIYLSDSGKLDPNPRASDADRFRAERTIAIFDLNRAGACINRRNAIKLIREAKTQEELNDVGYHFLIPICRAA